MRTVLYKYMYAHPRYKNTVGKDRESMRGKGTGSPRFWREIPTKERATEMKVIEIAVLLKTIKGFCLACILSDYEVEMCKPDGCPLFGLRLGKPSSTEDTVKSKIAKQAVMVRRCVGEQYGRTPIVEYVELPTIRQSWIDNDHACQS